MLKTKWAFVLLTALIGIAIARGHFIASSERNSHVIGLTYRTVTSPCETRAGSCMRPDPQGVVAEFMLPYSLWADDRKDRYDIKIHLNLFVNRDVVSPIPQDLSLKDLRRRNYLRGDNRTVALYAWREGESFEGFLRERGLRFASSHGLDYLKYEGIRNKYSIFDAEQCVNLAAEQLDMSGDPPRQDDPCLVSKVVKVSRNYEWAFASCLREYKVKPGRAKLSGCTIHSRIAPGLHMEYITDARNVDSDYWTEVDRRIREYILSLRLSRWLF